MKQQKIFKIINNQCIFTGTFNKKARICTIIKFLISDISQRIIQKLQLTLYGGSNDTWNGSTIKKSSEIKIIFII